MIIGPSTGLLSDDQCKARDVRRKARQKVQKPQPTQVDLPDSQQTPDSDSSIGQCPPLLTPDLNINPLEQMPQEQREMLEKLVVYQDEFELPREEDLQKISVSMLIDEISTITPLITAIVVINLFL